MILDEKVGWSSPLDVNVSGSCMNTFCCAEAERLLGIVGVGAGYGGISLAVAGCERVLLGQESVWPMERWLEVDGPAKPPPLWLGLLSEGSELCLAGPVGVVELSWEV
jgi:hypothetical protein